MKSIVLIDWPRIAVIDASDDQSNAGDEIILKPIPAVVGTPGVIEFHVRGQIALHGLMEIMDDRGVLRYTGGEPTRDASDLVSDYEDWVLTDDDGNALRDDNGIHLLLSDDAVITDNPVISCGMQWDIVRSIRNRRVSVTVTSSENVTYMFDDIVLPIELPS